MTLRLVVEPAARQRVPEARLLIALDVEHAGAFRREHPLVRARHVRIAAQCSQIDDALPDDLCAVDDRELLVCCRRADGLFPDDQCRAAVAVAERAADVMLKEKRRLVIVPRETPMSLPQLRNMVLCAEAGAMILPAMPAFYQQPKSLDDLADFMAGKILSALGLSHDLYPAWTGQVGS